MPDLDLDTVETARIPDFIEKMADFKPEDEILLWDSDIDKTRKAKLSSLRSFILSDGGSTIVPTQSGATVIYVVGDADAGGKVASIPSLAGEFFSLRRDGQPLLPETDPEVTDPDDPAYGEFAILVAGGFKLKQPADKLFKGQRYELVLAAAIGGSTGGTGTAAGAFIKGVKQISTNFTLTATHLNLLIQIRLGDTAAALTLPDLADIPENTIVPVEASINNNTSCKILTQGGQYIYFRNTSTNNASAIGLYILPGEQLWFFAGSDGWYVLNPSGNWGKIARPFSAFEIGLNEIWPTGQLVPRTGLYVRLWELANSLPYSLVDEAVWQTPSITVNGITTSRPYRGCFSRGDGSTTFRLPDLTEMTLKGLAAGADPLRPFNHPGGFQKDMVGSFTADITGKGAGVAGGNGGATNVVGLNSTVAGQANPAVAISDFAFDTGNAETMIASIGIFWAIKY